ncbi:MAG: RodZ domain-containing protein [Pseudomonadota bacterium]
MQLRGFDSYEVTLGDQMRGERASLGKSLRDVERDLRIKAHLITAIENCDLEGFPNKSVVAGYVRCYARYLGMNADECYTQFCGESGFQSPVAMIVKGEKLSGTSAHGDALNCSAGNQLGKSRFAAPPVPQKFTTGLSLGGAFSSLALIATVGGLTYGGYSVLQDIQRVGFAPLVEAPEIVSEAPSIAEPTFEAEFRPPVASDYAGSGALAAVAAPSDLPGGLKVRRDGPISAIDPLNYGVFARPEAEVAIREGVGSGLINSADDAILLAEMNAAKEEKTEVAETNEFSPLALPVEAGIKVHASELAWVRVSDSPNIVLFEGTLTPGEQYDIPATAAEPIIRAGNAGGVYVVLDGTPYGPIGERGRVVKNVPLTADLIRERFPKAASIAVNGSSEPSEEQRAAVDFD